MFSHFLNVNKRVEFVKGAPEITQVQKQARKVEFHGEEIQQFYGELIAGPSEESCSEYKNVDKPRRKSTLRRRNVPPQTKTTLTEVPLTERDERLFLKAAHDDNIELLIDYLDKGMDIETKDVFKWTAFLIASAEGALNVVKELLKRGCDVNYVVGNHSAKSLAKQKQRFIVLKVLERWELQHIPSTSTKYDSVDEEAPSDSGNTSKKINSSSHKSNPYQSIPSESPKSVTHIYCEACNVHPPESDKISHINSILHTVKSQHKPDKGFAYGIPMSNPGYRMLKESGWMEERGLGKEGQGKQYPIKTVLKRDRQGLGLEENKRKAKISHFEALDERAVETVKERKWNAKQIVLHADRQKKRQEQIRRMLNSD